MRSIDADAIYDTLSDIFIEYLATSSNTDTRNALDSLYHTVLSAVETAPTLSPDEVRGVGEWEDNYPILVELECLRCKNCNKLVQIGRYCANCGERKKGADGSE